MTDDSIGKAFEAEAAKETEELKAKVRPVIEEMDPAEIAAAIEAMGKASWKDPRTGARLGRRELVEAMIAEVVLKAEAGETLPKLPAARPSYMTRFAMSLATFVRSSLEMVIGPPPKPPAQEKAGSEADRVEAAKAAVEAQQKRTFRVTFAAAALFFAARSGHLALLIAALKESAVGEPSSRYDEGEFDEF